MHVGVWWWSECDWQVRTKPEASRQTDYSPVFPAKAVEIGRLASSSDWDVMVDRHKEWTVRGGLRVAAGDGM